MKFARHMIVVPVAELPGHTHALVRSRCGGIPWTAP